DSGTQSALHARIAQQAPGRRGARGARCTARLSLRRWACGAGDLSRILPPRAHRPRQPRRGDPGYATQPFPRHGACRGDAPGPGPTLPHVTGGAEVMTLVAALNLPLDARGQRRAAARAEWFAALGEPLEVDEVLDQP